MTRRRKRLWPSGRSSDRKGPVKLTKLSLTVVVVVIMAGVVLGVQALRAARRAAAREPVASGRTFGVPDARVHVEEFTDFQCPACAQAAAMLHEEMKKEGARLFVEVKHFPLAMHRHARLAAMAAQCALQQNRFWGMQESIFRMQAAWTVANDPTDYFLSLARGLGLDDEAMMRCLSDRSVAAVIDADIAEGKRLGVSATPTFFVNGKMAVGGPNFQAALREALK